jgi:hypothetical protein
MTALAGIVARHQPAIDLGNGRNYCNACGLDTKGPNGWPCDTVRVLALLRETREALAGLLDDTQHAKHDCGDADCPVVTAVVALAALYELAP